jgi:hypothetical protein
MEENFHTFHGQRDLYIESISESTVRFSMKSLAYKLLRKCQKDQVPAVVIKTVERCIEGIQMNEVTFLLNRILIDFEEVQDKGIKFHYAWLLILIALSSWREPYET